MQIFQNSFFAETLPESRIIRSKNTKLRGFEKVCQHMSSTLYAVCQCKKPGLKRNNLWWSSPLLLFIFWSIVCFKKCQLISCIRISFMHNVEKWSSVLLKSCIVHTVRFLKYVWPFFNIKNESFISIHLFFGSEM